MKWVTRARPKIDRIACPWLIARFIDPKPEFLYVPSEEVMRVAQESGATPYDIPGVALTHERELCRFDVFLRTYGLDDPALLWLAAIVRGADTGRLDLAPAAAGSMPSHWDCPGAAPTTMKCWVMAWSCTTRSTLGAGIARMKRTIGRQRVADSPRIAIGSQAAGPWSPPKSSYVQSSGSSSALGNTGMRGHAGPLPMDDLRLIDDSWAVASRQRPWRDLNTCASL